MFGFGSKRASVYVAAMPRATTLGNTAIYVSMPPARHCATCTPLATQHEGISTTDHEEKVGLIPHLAPLHGAQALLERLARETLTDGAVLAVNGLLPTASVRQLVQHAAALMCNLPSSGVKCANLCL